MIEREKHNFFTARQLHREGLIGFKNVGDKVGVCEAIEGMAVLNAAEGRIEVAATLFGYIEALRKTLGTPLCLPKHADTQPHMQSIRQKLFQTNNVKLWEKGMTLTEEGAMELALS